MVKQRLTAKITEFSKGQREATADQISFIAREIGRDYPGEAVWLFSLAAQIHPEPTYNPRSA